MTTSRKYRQYVLAFCGMLIASMILFGLYNNRLHQRTDRIEYEACVKTRQVAANQQRVIAALLALAVDHPHLARRSIELAFLARAHVPEFDCQK